MFVYVHAQVRFEFASWSSRGGWKENAFIMKFDTLCSRMKRMLVAPMKEIARKLYNSKNELPATCPWGPVRALIVTNIS